MVFPYPWNGNGWYDLKQKVKYALGIHQLLLKEKPKFNPKKKYSGAIKLPEVTSWDIGGAVWTTSGAILARYMWDASHNLNVCLTTKESEIVLRVDLDVDQRSKEILLNEEEIKIYNEVHLRAKEGTSPFSGFVYNFDVIQELHSRWLKINEDEDGEYFMNNYQAHVQWVKDFADIMWRMWD